MCLPTIHSPGVLLGNASKDGFLSEKESKDFLNKYLNFEEI